MADLPISSATTLTHSTIASGDLFPVLDISAASGSKGSKITLTELTTAVNATLLGQANIFTLGQTINAGTVTVSTPILSGTQTWNAGAVAFTALKINITNTTSASGSLFADFQLGGTSTIALERDGRIKGVFNPGFPQFTAIGLETSGMRVYSDRVDFWQNGSIPLTLSGSVADLGSGTLSWGAGIRLNQPTTNTLALNSASATPITMTISGAQGVGSNITGGTINIGTRGTGTGTGGVINFQTHAAGSTGSTLGTLVTVLSIKGVGLINIASIPTSSAGLSSGDIYSNSGVLTIVA